MKKQNNLRRKTLLVASLLAVASIGVGVAGTVAFFQSSHSFDVTVNAAKVDVAQGLPTIDSKTLAYEKDGADIAVDKKTYAVTANLLVPGDTFLIKVGYTNNSTIGVYYKVGVEATKGLDVAVYTDKACTKAATDGTYTKLAKGDPIADHYVKVTVTDDFENGGTGKVKVGVDAVQDNAPIEVLENGYKRDDAAKKVAVYSTAGLLKVQDYLSNKSDSEVNALTGYTLTLENDIDLFWIANWQGLITNKNRSFDLNFDGQGHTIRNLTITDGTGFIDHFGCTGAGDGISNEIKTDSKGNRYQVHGNYTFKNVVFDKANVVNLNTDTGNLGKGNCAGVVTGSTLGLDLEGVTVKNSSVEAYKWVGGLAGYLTGVTEGAANPKFDYQFQHVIKDCHVINTTVKARHYRAGGFIGLANPYSGEGYLKVSDSSVEGSTITAVDNTTGDKGWFVATGYNAMEGHNLTVNGTAITSADQKVNDILPFVSVSDSDKEIKID